MVRIRLPPASSPQRTGADVLRRRAERAEEDTSPFEVLIVSRGTDGSNPASSSVESDANLDFSRRLRDARPK
jgi:hypothetical protein